MFKEVLNNSNNIILWHKSEDNFRYKQEKVISKISDDSNFTFTG